MTEDGTLNALDLSVEGIITTGLQELDARFVKIHRDTAARLVATNRVSALIVGLDDEARTAKRRRRSAVGSPAGTLRS